MHVYIYIYSDLFRIDIMCTHTVLHFLASFLVLSHKVAPEYRVDSLTSENRLWLSTGSQPGKHWNRRPALFYCFGQLIGTQRWIWFIIHVYVINCRFCKLLVFENSQQMRLDVKWLAVDDWINWETVAVRAEPAPSPKPRLSIRRNPGEEACCLLFKCCVGFLCVNHRWARCTPGR